MKKLITLAFLAASLAALQGCSTVSNRDPEDPELINIDFGSTDLQDISAKMVRSLIDSPQLAYLDAPGKREDKRVIMFMGTVENSTSEHIETEAILRKIRTELVQSQRFRFVTDDSGQKQIGDQVRFQNEGRVDREKAKQFGRQIGADMILTGSLTSIEKSKKRSLESGLSKVQDVYYLFILDAVNIETGEIIWSEQKEIRKRQRKGVFGS